MLTQDDLKALSDLIDEKTKQLPTKEEFFTKMDEVMGELKSNREEQMVQVGIISEHSDQLEDHGHRIETLEHAVTPVSNV